MRDFLWAPLQDLDESLSRDWRSQNHPMRQPRQPKMDGPESSRGLQPGASGMSFSAAGRGRRSRRQRGLLDRGPANFRVATGSMVRRIAALPLHSTRPAQARYNRRVRRGREVRLMKRREFGQELLRGGMHALRRSGHVSPAPEEAVGGILALAERPKRK